MTTVADVAKAWALWKAHRDGCPAMQGADPCECEDEDTWDRFEEVLEDFLHPAVPAHDPRCYYLRSSDMDGDEAARCDCWKSEREPTPSHAAPREDEHAPESPAIVAAVEKFIQREDAHAARTHTVLGADGVVRTWAERVADVEARAALPLCPACAGLGVCAGCDGTGRDDGRRHAAWEAVGKAARDATCSCACAQHPSGGCGCPCVRHRFRGEL